MILYLDTSALVKRYVTEAGSEAVVALFDAAEMVGTSILTRVEMAAAFEKASRLEWVEREAASHLWKDFLEHWASFIRLNISHSVVERASQLAWEYQLRGYDAMHMASVLLWQETLGMPVNLVTYDRDLWKAGKKAGLLVLPETLDP